jgi:hypothetical protein
MSKQVNFRNEARKLIASFLAILIIYGAIIFAISHDNNAASLAVDDKLSSTLTKQRMDVYTRITAVDPLRGEAQARVEPWPISESLGYPYRSGWMPKEDVSLHIDAVLGSSKNGDNLYVFKKDVPTGGVDVTLDESSSGNASDVSRYPFDTYRFEVPMSATYKDAKGAVQDLAILPLDYTKSIDTFHVTMRHVLWTDSNKTIGTDAKSLALAKDEYEQGITSSVFDVTRSSSTKLLTLIIIILMLTGLASVTTMALMVESGRRPPTLGALTWAAALTFTLIGLRGLLPGSPPVGILIDKIIYFPTLLITLVCALSILITWSSRDDFGN